MAKTKTIDTIADLTPDPRNARKHTPRNVGMIEKALGEVGAARSIVIDEGGVILAGNATVEGAAAAGMTKLHVVDADGETLVAVRRSGLTAKQKTRLALYDNRAAELAEWDVDVLGDMSEGIAGMFHDGELDGLFREAPELSTIDGEDEEGAPRKDAALIQVKAVFLVDDAGTVERAIKATGQVNRGQSLVAICAAYLAADGVLGI